MWEKTELEKAVSKLSEHVNISFTVMENGTIETSDPSYDIAGLNDYITMITIRARDSALEAYERGKKEGYYEARRDMKPPLRGDFGFTNGKQKFLVWVDKDYIEAREVKDGNLYVMQNISKADVYK